MNGGEQVKHTNDSNDTNDNGGGGGGRGGGGGDITGSAAHPNTTPLPL